MATKLPSKTPRHLKPIPTTGLPPLSPTARSDTLHSSPIPTHTDARSFYLAPENQSLVPPPLISYSPFIPRSLIIHLMRKKKNSALGVKFVQKGGFRNADSEGDEITNMEGALHTFVTPVIGACEMIGDYRYDERLGGHGVILFGDGLEEEEREKVNWRERKWMARTVLLSASIHMDFEGVKVMLKVCKLDNSEVVGGDLGDWQMLSRGEKQEDLVREPYEDNLRRHMVFHLTKTGKLPARRDVDDAMDVETTIHFLDEAIIMSEDIEEIIIGKFTELYNDQIISLELLFNTAVHQALNEFSALEMLCPRGYVYTYNPASIFAYEISSASILNRLMVAAVKHLSNYNEFKNMRVFSISDYADKDIVSLATRALEKQSKVRVMSKDDLFRGVGGRYDIGKIPEAEGALLVIHNNSDGFGQNIETEYESGSLDGAIGSNSSGAASLERNRKDLLDFVV